MKSNQCHYISDCYVMSDGARVPKIGFGTWLLEKDDAYRGVLDALKVGYRHIDTAWGYGNEAEAGRAIRDSGIPRDEIFVTTKVHADFKDYASAKRGIEESLSRLDLGYVDLLLIHAPEPWSDFRNGHDYSKENLEVWRAMEEFQEGGLAKSLGVANFEEKDVANLLENAAVRPQVNQILLHVANTPRELLGYCQRNGILVEAYSPFGHGEILRNRVLAEMAGKYGVSPARLAIRYCLQLGALPLPKASSPAHMRENADVDGFDISDEDMGALLAIPAIKSYGEAAEFPVYGGKINPDGSMSGRDFVARK